MNQLGPYNTSFSNLNMLTPGGQDDELFSFSVRCRSTALLSSVVVAFSWVDDNGITQTELVPSLLLNALNQTARGVIPIRIGAGQSLVVSAALIGGGTFDILWAIQGI